MRPTLLGLSILILLALAWVFQGHGAGPEVLPTDGVPSVGQEPIQKAATLVEIPSELGREDVPAEDLPRLMKQPKLEEDHLLVKVFQGSKDEPAAFATVYVLNDKAMRKRIIEVDFFPNADFSHYFRKFGDAYRTDAQGHARLPVPEGRLVMAALQEGMFAMNFAVGSGTRKLELHMEPLFFVSAEVRGPDGQPMQGAPVNLRFTDSGRPTRFGTRTTNADGAARLEFPELILNELKSKANPVLELRVLAEESVEAPFPMDKEGFPTDEIVVLNMPETGAVDVHLTDASGHPMQEDVYLSLVRITADIEGKSLTPQSYRHRFVQDRIAHVDDGTHRFPFIALDSSLRISAITPDGERFATKDFLGPMAAGEAVEVVLQPVVANPILIGRVLNEEGLVGANLDLTAQIRVTGTPGSSDRSYTIHTDEGGRFRLQVARVKPADVRDVTIVMRRTKRKPRRVALAPMPTGLAPGIHDLGDLTVAPPPIAARGVVVDHLDEGVESAEIHLEREADGQGDSRWSEVTGVEVRTSEDGSFELRCVPRDGLYRLVARHDDHLQAIVPIRLGEEGALVRLGRTIRIEGSFLLDPGIPTSDLTVLAMNPHQRRMEFGRGVFLNRNGRFQLQNIPFEPQNLVLVSGATKEEVFRWDGLPMEFTGDTLDIGEIDLRGKLHVFRVRITDEEGRRVKDLFIKKPGDPYSLGLPSKTAILVTAQNSLDFDAMADGFRTLQVRGLDRDENFIMTKGIPIRLHCGNLPMIPEDLRFSVQLQSVDSEGVASSVPSTGIHVGKFLESPMVLIAPLPGRYFVSWRIRSKRGFLITSSSPSGPEGTYFDILDLDYPQDFHFQVVVPTPEDVRRIEAETR